MKKGTYIFIFVALAFLLTGCFNQEAKAKEIIKYIDQVNILQEEGQRQLSNYFSQMQEITRSEDISEMIHFLEDKVIPTLNEQIEGIHDIQLHYRPTKDLRDLHIEFIEYGISYYEWQLDVLYDEAPQNELEEIMKVEADIFGFNTERDSDTHYMIGLEEIKKKKRELNKTIENYWDIYNIHNYIDL